VIQISAHTPVFIGLDPIDFRCGIDKLSIISEQVSALDSKCGALFIFRNRQGTSFNLLRFDGTGFWLCQKRLSQGKVKYWPKSGKEAALSAESVLLILRGDDPRGTVSAPWKRVSTILDGKEARHQSKQPGYR
jgi:transposase